MMSETDFEQMVSPSMDFLKGRKDNFLEAEVIFSLQNLINYKIVKSQKKN